MTPEDEALGLVIEALIADAASIVALNPTLDRTYIARWATALGVADLWERVSRS